MKRKLLNYLAFTAIYFVFWKVATIELAMIIAAGQIMGELTHKKETDGKRYL